MEKIKVLGIDPSLRKSGMALLCYDTEKKVFEKPCSCQVLRNPQSFKGTEAILNMLDLFKIEADKPTYQNLTNVIIESPPVMFNKNWSSGTVSLIAHVAGGAAATFDLPKTHLFKPSEWNKARKKEKTHEATIQILGDPNSWGYEKRLKADEDLEHILDAVSMALWWIKGNYIDAE